jgi:hypothetical protein
MVSGVGVGVGDCYVCVSAHPVHAGFCCAIPEITASAAFPESFLLPELMCLSKVGSRFKLELFLLFSW